MITVVKTFRSTAVLDSARFEEHSTSRIRWICQSEFQFRNWNDIFIMGRLEEVKREGDKQYVIYSCSVIVEECCTDLWTFV